LSPCAAVRKVDLDVNPWFQRILISLAAGSAASGVIVGTAKKPRRLKKRKKKKGEKAEAVQLGALALADAKLPDNRGITVGEWRDAVVARGASVASVFKRKPKAPVDVDDGARLPDEVQAKDGTTVSKRAKKKKRNRAKDMPPATLWDSAKESFRQTVKETVHEEVKNTPVGGALDALKSVGAKMKEGASVVVENVEKVAQDVSDEVAKGVDKNKDPKDTVGAKIGSKLSDFRLAIDAAIETVRKTPPAANALTEDASTTMPPPADGPPSAPDELAVQPGAVEEQRGAPILEAELDPSSAGESQGVEKQPIDPEKVKQKLKNGFDAVSNWFQAQAGPSSPPKRDPTAPKRVRPAAPGDDVVEAKDTAANEAAPDVVEAKDAAPNDSTDPPGGDGGSKAAE
jgi:hypothetical protein